MVKQWHHLHGLNKIAYQTASPKQRDGTSLYSGNETGIIKMTRECCGRIMQRWDDDAGDWKMPSEIEPLISIMYRKRQCWAPISALTGTFLHDYRQVISDFITTLYDKKKKNIKDDTMVEMVLSLYAEMNKEKRAEFIHSEIFKKSKLAGYICHVCYKYSDSITKCIHTDCSRCCETCHKTPLLVPQNKEGGGDGTPDHPVIMDIVCPACKRTQEIKCPVCLEIKGSQELCLLGCHHVFCWKCYGMGVMKGQQMTKCPLCREEIVEVIEN